MSGLMKVMGKDPKGRAVMFRMVRGAVGAGMKPADDADQALRENRPADAARILHGLRGAIGVLGAKRLIRATLDAENAITEQRTDEWPAHFAEVRTVLADTLQQAEEWLEREENATT
jgi:HPt (histidine-containing phosphotransfer) domain-containing protein